jgi:hypothetical protein
MKRSTIAILCCMSMMVALMDPPPASGKPFQRFRDANKSVKRKIVTTGAVLLTGATLLGSQLQTVNAFGCPRCTIDALRESSQTASSSAPADPTGAMYVLAGLGLSAVVIWTLGKLAERSNDRRARRSR